MPRDPRRSRFTLVCGVLHAHERGFGPGVIAPATQTDEGLPLALDASEEVVRGEEHEVPAAIAEALHEVVLLRGDVLVMSGEHQKVVLPRQDVGARDLLEVPLREIVGLLA